MASLALMLAIPLLELGAYWAIPLSLFTSAWLIACLHAAHPGRRSVMIGIALASINLLLGRLACYENLRWIALLQAILWLGTLLYVTVTLLDCVFERKHIDIETLEAAICIYIMIGLVWLWIYMIMDLVRPDTFQFAETYNLAIENDRYRVFMRLFLFSFGSLTSSGHSGVTVRYALPKVCTSLEALSGQIYLAVVIARLVNLQDLTGRKRESCSVSGRSRRHFGTTMMQKIGNAFDSAKL